jgi:hypothetical protein
MLNKWVNYNKKNRLYESAYTVDDAIKNKIFVRIINIQNNDEVKIILMDVGEESSSYLGTLGIMTFGKEHLTIDQGPCHGAYTVQYAEARKGWGPLMYDIALEYVAKAGTYLAPDRASVSSKAKNVWDYYLNNRAQDVEWIQLDDLRNTLTKTGRDNCEQLSTEKYDEEFQDSSLSKGYRMKKIEKIPYMLNNDMLSYTVHKG